MRQPRIPVTVLQKTCLAPVLHKGPGSVLPAQMSAGNLVSSRQTTTRCKSLPDSPTDTRPGLATGGQANLSAAESQDTRFELCRSPAPQVRVCVCARALRQPRDNPRLLRAPQRPKPAVTGAGKRRGTYTTEELGGNRMLRRTVAFYKNAEIHF